MRHVRDRFSPKMTKCQDVEASFDMGYGTSETARFCQPHRRHLTIVSKFYGDAALYEPPRAHATRRAALP